MDTQNLIKMANQIAEFFHSMPDSAEAQYGFANHLKKFWDPRMRSTLLQAVQQDAADGLHPLANAALEKHRNMLIAQS